MFEKDFESMLRRYRDAVDDKKKFTGLIKDFFPQDTRTINLMLMAYEVGIVQQIQSTNRINNAFAYRFVKQLTDDYGLSRVNADWVVSVWCVCYGKNILGKECEIGIQSGKAPAIAPEQYAGTRSRRMRLFRRYQSYGDLPEQERRKIGY